MIVYKYLHPCRTSVLEEGLLRFSQAAVLNDPFETTLNMQRLKKSFTDHALRMLDQAVYTDAVEYVTARFKARALVNKNLEEFERNKATRHAVLSLSRANTSLLMWAHYCDSHRGFVIGFDADNAFFQTSRLNAFSLLSEVHYSDERPSMPAPDRWDGSQEQIAEAASSEDLAELFFYRKSSDWAYEQEMRMIASPDVADQVIGGDDGENIYLYRFPPECLREVVFGMRMYRAERERISSLVRERYPETRLFQAKLNAERFSLDLLPLN